MNNLNASKYKDMVLYGGERLSVNKEEINALNVFPVPDGDTGFNMNMTFSSGVEAVMSSNETNIGEMSKKLSSGLLLGARGNSGVILSQFFRGIAKGFEGLEEASVLDIHEAFQMGVKLAYASVIKAVEGTILTVAREMVEMTSPCDDVIEYFENLLANSRISLENTPNLLPVLKEAGVVDSGGAGLVYIIEGMVANLKGEILEITSNFEAFTQTEVHSINPDDIEFAYCTEMLIKLNSEIDLNDVRLKIEGFGDSIVAINDEDILKVHVHTNLPTEVFAYGITMGDFIHVKSENMKIQALEAQAKMVGEIKEIGIVTVSSSEGMSDLFRSMADLEIIEGGQTLNPSIENIKDAIERANAKNVIVLPNNSNIIMAAEAAKELVDINVEVIKTKHLTQALEALAHYNLESDFRSNVDAMTASLEGLTNIEITNAIKDTQIEGVEIAKNDFLAIVNGKIKYSMASETQMLAKLVSEFIENDVELITILLGEGGDAKLVSEIVDYIEEKSPFIEVEVHETKQPVYSYLISAL